MQVARIAAAEESLMLVRNEDGKSECSKKALNHRSEKSLVGKVIQGLYAQGVAGQKNLSRTRIGYGESKVAEQMLGAIFLPAQKSRQNQLCIGTVRRQVERIDQFVAVVQPSPEGDK